MNIRKSLITLLVTGLLISTSALAMEPNEQEQLDQALALSLEQSQSATEQDELEQAIMTSLNEPRPEQREQGEFEQACALSLEEEIEKQQKQKELERTLAESKQELQRDEENKKLHDNIEEKITASELHCAISHEIMHKHTVVDLLMREYSRHLKTEWLKTRCEQEFKKLVEENNWEEDFKRARETTENITENEILKVWYKTDLKEIRKRRWLDSTVSMILNLFAQLSEEIPFDIYSFSGTTLQKLGEILSSIEPQIAQLREYLTNRLTIEQATLLDSIWKSKEKGEKFALTKELALVYMSLADEVKKALKDYVIRPSLEKKSKEEN